MIMYEILSAFEIDGDIISSSEYGHGHINKTYLVTTTQDKKYILQMINSNVFKKPRDVMENIELVTNHIRQKESQNGNDCTRCSLEIVNTKKGATHIKIRENYWRCYKYIDGARTHEKISDPIQFYEVGKAVGKFQVHLDDFPIEKLNITIPNFHNTPKRYETFLRVAESDVYDRGLDIFNEIKFICDRQDDMKIIEDGLNNRTIPYRVTHNDTKLNNVMLNEVSNEAICIIDLDTVMPGSVLYDFGDAIRVGASTAVEDEKDLNKIKIDFQLFELFTKGFLEVVHHLLKPAEIENLVTAAKIITLECGMRFLTDYLDGDRYFAIHYPEHNLVRARAQFKFVSEIEKNYHKLQAIVDKVIRELKKNNIT